MNKNYPRDMVGYGKVPMKVEWPDRAKLALQIVLNYEEGSEKLCFAWRQEFRSFFIRNYRSKTY